MASEDQKQKALDAGWKKWDEVLSPQVPYNQHLYRSACPNYDGHDDESQSFTRTSLDFIQEIGITTIISFNNVQYSPYARTILSRAVPPIEYLWIPLPDFTAPTRDQICQMADLVDVRQGSTLVHCGAGFGRTGTGITALELHWSWGTQPEPGDDEGSNWKEKNKVEEPCQVAALKDWADYLKQHIEH